MSTRRVVIDPVTRIEGHAKISIFLDESGEVRDAQFHVTEFRGFEKFCEGRPLGEMAGITARVCGICPVSHILASAKAGDDIFAVDIPPAAEKLRRLMNLGQIVQSHALSFFHLSSPDLLLGFDSNPAQRNLFGLIAQHPEFARGGIRLRQFGQEIIELLGGRKIHPAWAVPGGVREPLTPEKRNHILCRVPEARQTTLSALAFVKRYIAEHREEVENFGNFPTLFLGLVSKDGAQWEHYDGYLRVVDSEGNILVDGHDPRRYTEIIGEAVEPHSYLKSPYFKPWGYPEGAYRVGPLARLNLCTRMGTPLADAELAEFRQHGNARGIVLSSFMYHYARLIEILAATERIEQLLNDPDILSSHVRAGGAINKLEGVGVSEAPRGTLFHHYQVDAHGMIRRVNLIIATGQNNLAMNRTVKQIAQHWIHGARDAQIPEGLLNRVEAGIRAFDPCLSCSTHAVGQMPLVVQLFDAQGRLIDEVRRD
ncbi:MAG: Ni/Fe hydrogenase subunit alpha [Thermoflexales bacterium]|nr:Ni/Fe hydrogenase subunit alpha [Thermoflexales bacterium]MCS7324018.1 Ni/Fe hydrogenase subunit alpha [Thermoflexales bacterium]MCX7939393.1 Ni/Fe hydrogenase subunit alpha [Thermoflexales bacterium]MDW8053502.1 Ni/Fe hydrogenase subunit alpha [Anaerolineae bacterium]MDW8292202.1 Ni/Fe hydrogenase subunit alpha [Anaerolineae bacterium]